MLGKPCISYTCKNAQCLSFFMLHIFFLQLFIYNTMKCSQLCRRLQLRPLRHSWGRQETLAKNNMANLPLLCKMPQDLCCPQKADCTATFEMWTGGLFHTCVAKNIAVLQVSSTHGSSVFQNGMTPLCHSLVSEVTDSTNSFHKRRGSLAPITQPELKKLFCMWGLSVPHSSESWGRGSGSG